MLWTLLPSPSETNRLYWQLCDRVGEMPSIQLASTIWWNTGSFLYSSCSFWQRLHCQVMLPRQTTHQLIMITAKTRHRMSIGNSVSVSTGEIFSGRWVTWDGPCWTENDSHENRCMSMFFRIRVVDGGKSRDWPKCTAMNSAWRFDPLAIWRYRLRILWTHLQSRSSVWSSVWSM